jgi:hypothetical protein
VFKKHFFVSQIMWTVHCSNLFIIIQVLCHVSSTFIFKVAQSICTKRRLSMCLWHRVHFLKLAPQCQQYKTWRQGRKKHSIVLSLQRIHITIFLVSMLTSANKKRVLEAYWENETKTGIDVNVEHYTLHVCLFHAWCM